MKKGIVYIIVIRRHPYRIASACKEAVPTVFAEPDGIYFSAPSDSVSIYFCQISQPACQILSRCP